MKGFFTKVRAKGREATTECWKKRGRAKLLCTRRGTIVCPQMASAMGVTEKGCDPQERDTHAGRDLR